MSNATDSDLAAPAAEALPLEAAQRGDMHGRLVTSSLSDEALDAMLQATAATIRLDIPVDCLVGVRENLRALIAVAQTLAEPQAQDYQVVEFAPVYRA